MLALLFTAWPVKSGSVSIPQPQLHHSSSYSNWPQLEICMGLFWKNFQILFICKCPHDSKTLIVAFSLSKWKQPNTLIYTSTTLTRQILRMNE